MSVVIELNVGRIAEIYEQFVNSFLLFFSVLTVRPADSNSTSASVVYSR